MSEHAKLSPSSAHRWMKCPGSIKLSEGIPDESSEYADEGTFAHAVAADCLEHGAKCPDPNMLTAARKYLEDVYYGKPSPCGRFVVDGEMFDALRTYFVAVHLALTLFGKKDDDVKLMVEQRVTVIPDLVWGTSDVVLLIGDELHVFDLKYGSGVWVDVRDNAQLKLYALGALGDLDDLASAVTTVFVHIVQPRHNTPKWRTARYTLDDLDVFGDEVVAAVARVEEDEPTFEAGDHCKFCPAKPTCPTLRKATLGEAQKLFAPKPTPPAPTDMTPEMIGKALTVGAMLEDWLKAVRKHAYELADKHRKPIPGWKLVSKGGAHRKWVDDEEAERTLTMMGIYPYAEKKLATPAQVEKRCKDKSVKAAVGALFYQPDAGTALVPESDERDAVKQRVQFQPVEKRDD